MKILTGIAVIATLLISCKESESTVRMNDLQIIGSHNSYKIAIERPILDYIASIDSTESIALEYEHIGLTEQLDLGLRNLELDIFYDPDGGYYQNPAGQDIVRSTGTEPQPFDEADKLEKPGLKVFHIQEIDFRSHQLLFMDALREINIWSDSHPDHSPIIITINAKDHAIANGRKPLLFDMVALQTIDEEILQVMDAEDLITPDLVRSRYQSLNQAIISSGWPDINEVNGRVMFVLDEMDPKRTRYLSVFPRLKEAVLFLNLPAGHPESAFMVMNDPITDFDSIKLMVAQGYMVRTRADAGTIEARNEDYHRFEMAKKSGAQVITTDYYLPSQLFDSDFQVRFKDGSYEQVN